MRASVVDDNVGDGFEVAVVQGMQALAQLALAAVGAVQVVVVARQVPLRADAVAGGRQPHAGDASICYEGRLVFQDLPEPAHGPEYFHIIAIPDAALSELL